MSAPQKDLKSQPVHEDPVLMPYGWTKERQDLIDATYDMVMDKLLRLSTEMMNYARSNPWKVDQAIADAWKASHE